jgi:phosphoribosylformylglycinamidine synthase
LTRIPGIQLALTRFRIGPLRGSARNDEDKMKARVTVTLKNGILDPQGKAIEGALKSLGVDGIASVRQGKVFDIEVEGGDREKVEAALKAAADRLLANTVIENYAIEVKA